MNDVIIRLNTDFRSKVEIFRELEEAEKGEDQGESAIHKLIAHPYFDESQKGKKKLEKPEEIEELAGLIYGVIKINKKIMSEEEEINAAMRKYREDAKVPEDKQLPWEGWWERMMAQMKREQEYLERIYLPMFGEMRNPEGDQRDRWNRYLGRFGRLVEVIRLDLKYFGMVIQSYSRVVIYFAVVMINQQEFDADDRYEDVKEYIGAHRGLFSPEQIEFFERLIFILGHRGVMGFELLGEVDEQRFLEEDEKEMLKGAVILLVRLKIMSLIAWNFLYGHSGPNYDIAKCFEASGGLLVSLPKEERIVRGLVFVPQEQQDALIEMAKKAEAGDFAAAHGIVEATLQREEEKKILNDALTELEGKGGAESDKALYDQLIAKIGDLEAALKRGVDVREAISNLEHKRGEIGFEGDEKDYESEYLKLPGYAVKICFDVVGLSKDIAWDVCRETLTKSLEGEWSSTKKGFAADAKAQIASISDRLTTILVADQMLTKYAFPLLKMYQGHWEKKYSDEEKAVFASVVEQLRKDFKMKGLEDDILNAALGAKSVVIELMALVGLTPVDTQLFEDFPEDKREDRFGPIKFPGLTKLFGQDYISKVLYDNKVRYHRRNAIIEFKVLGMLDNEGNEIVKTDVYTFAGGVNIYLLDEDEEEGRGLVRESTALFTEVSRKLGSGEEYLNDIERARRMLFGVKQIFQIPDEVMGMHIGDPDKINILSSIVEIQLELTELIESWGEEDS